MTGKTLNKKLAKWHFWTMFIFFNLTFFPMFIIGLLGQPRRVFEYATNLQTLNDISSFSAFLLGASFFIFITNVVWSDLHRCRTRLRRTLGTRWAWSGRPPTPVPWLQLRAHPRRPQRPVSLQRVRRSAGGGPGTRSLGRRPRRISRP